MKKIFFALSLLLTACGGGSQGPALPDGSGGDDLVIEADLSSLDGAALTTVVKALPGMLGGSAIQGRESLANALAKKWNIQCTAICRITKKE